MKRTVDALFRSKVRDWEKIARSIHAIDRLRRKPPPGWNSTEVLRRLREKREGRSLTPSGSVVQGMTTAASLTEPG